MSTKFYSLCTALLIVCGAVHAQDCTITMKDGTVYRGYVAEQTFDRNSTVTLAFSMMTIAVDSRSDISPHTARYRLSELSEEWQVWARNNKKVESDGGEESLTLTSMSLAGYERLKYYMLESGTTFSKYVTLSPGSVRRSMSDIYCIQKNQRDAAVLTDIDDIISTKYQTFIGVILEQYPGKQYKIWDKNDKGVHIVSQSEITRIGKAAFNPDIPMRNQAALVERFKLKNGGYTDYGVITQYGAEMTLVTASMTQNFKLSELTSLERTQNKDFEPLTDILLNPDETVVNRGPKLEFTPVSEFKSKSAYTVYYIAQEMEKQIISVSKPSVTVESTIKGIDDVYVIKATRRDIPQGKKKVYSALSYTVEDVFNTSIKVEKTVSINGTLKISFDLNSPDIYFVYVKSLNKAWMLKYDPTLNAAKDRAASALKGKVVIGTKKELHNAGIPETVTDATALDLSKLDPKKVIEVDINTFREFSLNAGKYRFVTPVDEESYSVSKKDKKVVVITIENPGHFWNKAGILIIQMD